MELSVLVLSDVLSFVPQEIMVKLKRSKERFMKKCLIRITNWLVYENLTCTMISDNLQEFGILLGGFLTVKN